ncbi:MAG: ATP-binding protein [Treponema sp.]|jgi:anti-sigma regulatory factor (Ser/Thr protein kinase)|nr:ATP-binding protein [Treponema sp.]
MQSITVDAVVTNLDTVLNFTAAYLEEADCPLETMIQISIVVEELFVNIANYAYPPYHTQAGTEAVATITGEVDGDPLGITLQFIDGGVPYNPLEKPDPDITLPAEARAIGGLGIYLVKKMVDTIQYEYREGKNMLTIRKKFATPRRS